MREYITEEIYKPENIKRNMESVFRKSITYENF